ncbi:MAG: GNAT family N-acetyltransferase [Motiliproteus sp.]|nr:GNAT family N-acetyltransferase [Motiliproteus sp.]MCW9053927.1 GNAT family N-acetyltransferase [Motiliproteus sp.]
MLRPLQSEDAEAFMALRLKAIGANPECFCSTLSEVQQQGLDHYRQLIDLHLQSSSQQLLGAFSKTDQLQGVIALERLNGALRTHRGRIWGLLVDPDCRRQGTARALCQQALESAKQMELEKINLELTGEAVAALHLYRDLGFRIESIEPLAFKLDGRYLDEIRMSRCL